MRIPSVLLALVLGLASLGAASAAEQPQPSLYFPAPSVKPDLLNSAAEAIPIDKSYPANERPKGPRNNKSPLIALTPTFRATQ
jgi:hypothetical protein